MIEFFVYDDKYGLTAVINAAFHGHTMVAQSLLDHGCDASEVSDVSGVDYEVHDDVVDREH
jgi:hypothetical protein